MTSPVVQEDVKTVVGLVGDGFKRLAGKNLLLTGGTGFIGSYLLETLAHVNDHVLAEPCRVYTLTRDPKKAASRFSHLQDRSDLMWIAGDVRRLPPSPVPWHFVIHAAALSDVRAFMQDPAGTMETIVEGTRAVLAAATREVEAVLFVSSGAVYGHQPPELLRLAEDHAGGPDLRDVRSCYAEAKRGAELLCRIFRERQRGPVTIARPFTLVGPYQDVNATSAVIDFIRQGLEGATIRIRDDGRAIRSYCYVADAVTALWKLLLGPQTGEAVNVGSDAEPVSFHELAQRVGRCLAKPVAVVVEGAPALGVLGRRYVPDVSRLERLTGFRPGTTLDDALSRTIAWMKERRITGVPVP